MNVKAFIVALVVAASVQTASAMEIIVDLPDTTVSEGSSPSRKSSSPTLDGMSRKESKRMLRDHDVESVSSIIEAFEIFQSIVRAQAKAIGLGVSEALFDEFAIQFSRVHAATIKKMLAQPHNPGLGNFLIERSNEAIEPLKITAYDADSDE